MDHPDISVYQGDVDWAVMRSKTNYIIMKATQRDWTDTRFHHNAYFCGLPLGVYHMYDDRSSPGVQASHFAKEIKDYNPLEMWCDYEKTYNGAYSGIGDVVAFMQRVEDLTGKPMGMYTGYYWFVEHTDKVRDASQLKYLGQRPLWLAWYNRIKEFPFFTNEGVEKVLIPRPWTTMDVWQWGTPAIGREYGVSSIEIDMNKRFDGFNPEDRSHDPKSRLITANFGDTLIEYEEIK